MMPRAYQRKKFGRESSREEHSAGEVMDRATWVCDHSL
jgi:hypothetical protein